MSHLEEGQLHELLDGELDESARAAALAHLATCERCRAAYEEAKSFVAESDALIDAVQLPAVPVALAAAAAPVAPIPADVRDIASAGRLRRYRALAWAASVMLAVGLGWYGSSLSRQVNTESGAASTVTALDSGAKKDPEPMLDATAQSATPQPVVIAKQAMPRDEVVARQRVATPAGPPAEAVVAEKSRLAAEEDKAAAPAIGGADRTMASADAAPPPAQTANEVAQPAPATTAPAAAPSPAPAEPLTAFSAERRKEASAGIPTRRARASTAMGVSAPRRFSAIDMEEAVRILGGSIRLIDGLTPVRFLSTPEPIQVRVVYEDPPGRELWLDQSRSTLRGYVGALKDSATTVLPGDTTAVQGSGGSRSLVWIDQSGFQLTLTGFLPADSLRQLVRRVQ